MKNFWALISFSILLGTSSSMASGNDVGSVESSSVKYDRPVSGLGMDGVKCEVCPERYGSEADAEQEAADDMEKQCSDGTLSNIVIPPAKCTWLESNWTKFRYCSSVSTATCTRTLTIDSNVNKGDFEFLLKRDSPADALKILRLSASGEIDLQTFKLLRSKTMDSFIQAADIARKMITHPQYAQCYLEFRNGAQLGKSERVFAEKACNLIIKNYMDYACYRENIIGPLVGTLYHNSAEEKCLTALGREHQEQQRYCAKPANKNKKKCKTVN